MTKNEHRRLSEIVSELDTISSKMVTECSKDDVSAILIAQWGDDLITIGKRLNRLSIDVTTSNYLSDIDDGEGMNEYYEGGNG